MNINKLESFLDNKKIEYAVFDIDDTISKTTILNLYFYLKKKSIGNRFIYKLWLVYFCVTHIPIYLIADAISRDLFQKSLFPKLSNFPFKSWNHTARIVLLK